MVWESREVRDRREVAEAAALAVLVVGVHKTVSDGGAPDVVRVQVEPYAYDKTRFSYYLWFAPVPVEEGGTDGDDRANGECVEVRLGHIGVNAMVRVGERWGRNKIQISLKKATVEWIVQNARAFVNGERLDRVRDREHRAAAVSAHQQAVGALGFGIGYLPGATSFGHDVTASLDAKGALRLQLNIRATGLSANQVLRIKSILEEGK